MPKTDSKSSSQQIKPKVQPGDMQWQELLPVFLEGQQKRDIQTSSGNFFFRTLFDEHGRYGRKRKQRSVSSNYSTSEQEFIKLILKKNQPELKELEDDETVAELSSEDESSSDDDETLDLLTLGVSDLKKLADLLHTRIKTIVAIHEEDLEDHDIADRLEIFCCNLAINLFTQRVLTKKNSGDKQALIEFRHNYAQSLIHLIRLLCEVNSLYLQGKIDNTIFKQSFVKPLGILAWFLRTQIPSQLIEDSILSECISSTNNSRQWQRFEKYLLDPTANISALKDWISILRSSFENPERLQSAGINALTKFYTTLCHRTIKKFLSAAENPRPGSQISEAKDAPVTSSRKFSKQEKKQSVITKKVVTETGGNTKRLSLARKAAAKSKFPIPVKMPNPEEKDSINKIQAKRSSQMVTSQRPPKKKAAQKPTSKSYSHRPSKHSDDKKSAKTQRTIKDIKNDISKISKETRIDIAKTNRILSEISNKHKRANRTIDELILKHREEQFAGYKTHCNISKTSTISYDGVKSYLKIFANLKNIVINKQIKIIKPYNIFLLARKMHMALQNEFLSALDPKNTANKKILKRGIQSIPFFSSTPASKKQSVPSSVAPIRHIRTGGPNRMSRTRKPEKDANPSRSQKRAKKEKQGGEVKQGRRMKY